MLLFGNSLISILYSLPGIIIAFSFHEFAHAWMSNKLGDPTPKAQGRLTISPLVHVDPMGLVFLLLFGFGYGKPVQVDPHYYKNRRAGQIMVSLAGVVMNFFIALFTYALLALLLKYRVIQYDTAVANVVYAIAKININIMVFNLLPVPPLDGYQALKQIFLGDKTINILWQYERYGFIILMVLLFFGVTRSWIVFLSDHVLNFILFLLSWI